MKQTTKDFLYALAVVVLLALAGYSQMRDL
jgi:hypothetical protein